MKLRVAAILLLFLFIHFPALASPAPASDPSVVPSLVENISHQASDLLQHNALNVNLTKLQQNLNENIAIKIKELKEQQRPLLLFSLLMLAFIYGVFHGMGPGHGKSIISSWIISQQRSLKDVLFISIFATAFHALSAALIVGGTYVIMEKFAAVSTQKLNTYLQIAAAILVIIIGLGMILGNSSVKADFPLLRNTFTSCV
jgi:nickel/cobalt transporter (NicO) family protein